MFKNQNLLVENKNYKIFELVTIFLLEWGNKIDPQTNYLSLPCQQNELYQTINTSLQTNPLSKVIWNVLAIYIFKFIKLIKVDPIVY